MRVARARAAPPRLATTHLGSASRARLLPSGPAPAPTGRFAAPLISSRAKQETATNEMKSESPPDKRPSQRFN